MSVASRPGARRRRDRYRGGAPAGTETAEETRRGSRANENKHGCLQPCGDARTETGRLEWKIDTTARHAVDFFATHHWVWPRPGPRPVSALSARQRRQK